MGTKLDSLFELIFNTTMKKLTIAIFCLLYILVSFVSTIHIINFFELSNSHWLSVTLGIAFELGAAASLCSIAFLERANRYVVWGLFVILTLFQVQSNMFVTFRDLHDYKSWVELFWLSTADPITQKRIISIVAGAILPIVALGFIKALVDYMRPGTELAAPAIESQIQTDEIPADFDFKSSLAAQSDSSAPILKPVEFEQDYVLPSPANENQNVKIDTIDDQILRNRELAAELVSEPAPESSALNSQQIDKNDSGPAIAVSPDTKIGRGMQINRS
jgi:hypothetical protein